MLSLVSRLSVLVTYIRNQAKYISGLFGQNCSMFPIRELKLAFIISATNLKIANMNNTRNSEEILCHLENNVFPDL